MQAWAGFAGVGAVIWAAHLGKSGFNDWLQEKQTERRMTAAERLMTLVYKAQRTIPAIRNPGSFWAENAAAEKRLVENQPGFESWEDEKKDRYRASQIVLDRLQANKELWANLFECLPLAKAFYGDNCEQQLDRLWGLHTKLLVSANTYARTMPDSNQGLSDRAFDDLFGHPEADPIDQELSELVAYFETTVLPDLVGKRQRDAAINESPGG
jgi:hypothetical protein